MQIKRTIKGHTFAVQLRAVERAGVLANGATAYTAHVTIYCDGRDIGSGRWGGEGFESGPATMADVDDSEDVYRELAVAIRDYLAALPVETSDRAPIDFLAMPLGGTSHPVMRLMAARMTDPLRTGPIVSVGMADGDLARRIIEMLRDAAKDNEHIPAEYGEKSPMRHQCIGRLAAWQEALFRAEALEREVRAAAATSTQRVTFAPGLRGDELRCMASTARLTASRMTLVPSLQAERRAWVALADALDAAAERDEAVNAPEAP